MSIKHPVAFTRIAGGATLLLLVAAGPAPAADLPFMSSPAPWAHDGGGGFRVASVPVRPPPLRYDIYGYPLLAGAPNPLAAGGGCPAAIQPVYDSVGNFAGYGPLPMCR